MYTITEVARWGQCCLVTIAVIVFGQLTLERALSFYGIFIAIPLPLPLTTQPIFVSLERTITSRLLTLRLIPLYDFVGNNRSHNHVSWFHPYGHSQLGPSIFFSIQNMLIVSMVSFFTNRAPSHCQIRDSWVWSLRLAQRSKSSMRWELDGVHHDASVYESVEVHWEVEWVTGETLTEVNCP